MELAFVSKRLRITLQKTEFDLEAVQGHSYWTSIVQSFAAVKENLKLPVGCLGQWKRVLMRGCL